MAITSVIAASLAILVGILVLIWPRILRVALGLWLIIWGILQLI